MNFNVTPSSLSFTASVPRTLAIRNADKRAAEMLNSDDPKEVKLAENYKESLAQLRRTKKVNEIILSSPDPRGVSQIVVDGVQRPLIVSDYLRNDQKDKDIGTMKGIIYIAKDLKKDEKSDLLSRLNFCKEVVARASEREQLRQERQLELMERERLKAMREQCQYEIERERTARLQQEQSANDGLGQLGSGKPSPLESKNGLGNSDKNYKE